MEQTLSRRTKEVILGSLLGDGSLKIHQKYKNARFSFRHSIKQKEYFFWKKEQLKDISSDRCWWLQENDGKGSNGKLRYQSLALPALSEVYQAVCDRGKFKIQRNWLNQLTPLSLAVWWMDDGSVIANGRKGVFCTDSFSYREQLTLLEYLKNVWKIETKIGKLVGPDRYRLFMYSAEQTKRFLRTILPYISVKYMIPKILLLYKDSLLQQRWISEVSQLTEFSENLLIKYLKEKKQKWKNFRE